MGLLIMKPIHYNQLLRKTTYSMHFKQPMWLVKLWQRWQLRRLSAEVHQISYTKPNRALCEKLWHLLDVRAFAHYHPQQGSLLRLTVIYPTIERYIRQLKEINFLLAQGDVLSQDWGRVEEIHCSLDEFLTSDDGHYYIDQMDAVRKLQEQALRLCELMRTADLELVGRHEHNLRILAKHLISLRQLALELTRANL